MVYSDLFLWKLKRIFLLLIFFCVTVLQSCNHEEERFKGYVENLRKDPISVPLDKLSCLFDEEKISIISVNDSCMLKLVIYTDSIECSSCRMKEMYKWDDFLSKLGAYSSQIEVFFIFAPLYSNMGLFKMVAKDLPQNYPIYIDTTNIFYRENPQIPSNPALHTFLLDEQNNVILVGNPLKNKKIEKLFWQIVEEKLGKRE